MNVFLVYLCAIGIGLAISFGVMTLYGALYWTGKKIHQKFQFQFFQLKKLKKHTTEQ